MVCTVVSEHTTVCVHLGGAVLCSNHAGLDALLIQLVDEEDVALDALLVQLVDEEGVEEMALGEAPLLTQLHIPLLGQHLQWCWFHQRLINTLLLQDNR